MERELKFTFRAIDAATAVYDLTGDMNIYNANTLGEDFEKQTAKGVKNYVINMKDLAMIDSAGIGVLFTILSTVQGMEGQAILLSPNQNIRKLFDITQVSTYFVILENEAEALAKIQAV